MRNRGNNRPRLTPRRARHWGTRRPLEELAQGSGSPEGMASIEKWEIIRKQISAWCEDVPSNQKYPSSN